MRTTVLAAGAASLMLSASAAGAADTSFAGKTIRIVVNFAAGGPADSFARHFQPFIAARIPGNPTVVVENRTGAGGRVGANFIYNAAPKDGTTVGFLVGLASADIIGGKNVKFDAPKFRWLGAVKSTQVLLAGKGLGITGPAGLLRPAEPVVYGQTGPVTVNALATRLFLGMIGVKYKMVTGYRGQALIIQAMRKGEVNFTDSGIAAYLPNRETWQREGLFAPIAQRGELQPDGGFARNAAIPDLPTMAETVAALNPAAQQTPEFVAFRTLVGTYGVHFPLVLPPGAPQDATATLGKAVAGAYTDPKARAAAIARFKFEYDFVDGPSAQAFVDKLFVNYKADPRVPQVVQALVKTRNGK